MNAPRDPSSKNHQDDCLGLNEPISRRDFLNDALLAGAGLLLHGEAPTISPEDAFNGYGGIGDYAHSNGFFFGLNGKPAPRDVLRGAPHGRIAFANTDLAGASDHRNSIREADRAVRQILNA
jgi:hypothetical protein